MTYQQYYSVWYTSRLLTWSSAFFDIIWEGSRWKAGGFTNFTWSVTILSWNTIFFHCPTSQNARNMSSILVRVSCWQGRSLMRLSPVCAFKWAASHSLLLYKFSVKWSATSTFFNGQIGRLFWLFQREGCTLFVLVTSPIYLVFEHFRLHIRLYMGRSRSGIWEWYE